MRASQLIAWAVLAVVTMKVGAQDWSPTDASTEVEPQLEDGQPRELPLDASGQEKQNAGWAVAFDNDLLSFADRDFDEFPSWGVSFAFSDTKRGRSRTPKYKRHAVERPSQCEAHYPRRLG